MNIDKLKIYNKKDFKKVFLCETLSMLQVALFFSIMIFILAFISMLFVSAIEHEKLDFAFPVQISELTFGACMLFFIFISLFRFKEFKDSLNYVVYSNNKLAEIKNAINSRILGKYIYVEDLNGKMRRIKIKSVDQYDSGNQTWNLFLRIKMEVFMYKYGKDNECFVESFEVIIESYQNQLKAFDDMSDENLCKLLLMKEVYKFLSLEDNINVE